MTFFSVWLNNCNDDGYYSEYSDDEMRSLIWFAPFWIKFFINNWRILWLLLLLLFNLVSFLFFSFYFFWYHKLFSMKKKWVKKNSHLDCFKKISTHQTTTATTTNLPGTRIVICRWEKKLWSLNTHTPTLHIHNDTYTHTHLMIRLINFDKHKKMHRHESIQIIQ